MGLNVDQYQDTFTKEDITVTVVAQGEAGSLPVEGGRYKVVYLCDGENEAETEWMEGFRNDRIYSELESLAEDWLDAEIKRRERSFER
jgi:hypothetical protein